MWEGQSLAPLSLVEGPREAISRPDKVCRRGGARLPH